MAALLTATIFVGFAVIAVAIRFHLDREPPDILTTRTHAKVIVTLKSGSAFRGVLREQDARAFVLVNADGLGVGERGTDVGVDGELLILREEIDYVQVL